MMIDRSIGPSTSPKQGCQHHWNVPEIMIAEDGSPLAQRRSALRLIARRILVKREEHEEKPARKRRIVVAEDSPIHRTKMDILAKNPAIYQTFREGLKENFYTHWGVSYSLQYFLDTRLLIPELKEDIINHPLNHRSQSSRGSLFAYYLGSAVTGSPTPSNKHHHHQQQHQQQQRSSPPVSPAWSEQSAQRTNTLLADSLRLPSLERTDHEDDDDDDDEEDSDGIVSVGDVVCLL